MQYLAGGGCKFKFCIKLVFPYNKGINLFYYSQVIPIFEKVPPTQTQLTSIIIKPISIKFKSDEINNNIQFWILKMSITRDKVSHPS